MSDSATGRTGLYALGAVLAVQWGFLLLVQLREVSQSSVLPIVVLGLSVAAAILFRVDARRVWESADHWWEPRYRWWTLGGLPFGINVGVAIAYAIRRHEARTEPRSTDRWKWIAVGGAVATAVGTSAVRFGGATFPLEVLAVVALLSLNALGLTAIAIFYDLRHVAELLEDAGEGWLFQGYHWIVLVALLIPANALFSLVYLYRRRSVLRAGGVPRAGGERDVDPDEEAAGDAPSWRE